MHLEKFGWRPTVITVRPDCYEGELEPSLCELIPDTVEVIRTPALPIRPIRIVGDVGVRAFWWHYRVLADLAQRGEVDFILIPIPPNYSAMLGRLIHRRYKVPYGIDFIDPWVHPWPGSERRFSKAWLAYNLGRWLEPKALRDVGMITAVAPGYYEGARRRYSWLSEVPCGAMPYGAEERDFSLLETHPRAPYLFKSQGTLRHIVYAGAMLPQAVRALELLFAALKEAAVRDPAWAESLCFHFIGTGTGVESSPVGLVTPLAQRFGVQSLVREHPARIPYLDVLAHLKAADAVLVLGSTEAHYTPSKIFQAVLSRRPVIALLHSESTALKILSDARTGHVIKVNEHEATGADAAGLIWHAIKTAIAEGEGGPLPYRKEAIASYTAEASTKELARLLDSALRTS